MIANRTAGAVRPCSCATARSAREERDVERALRDGAQGQAHLVDVGHLQHVGERGTQQFLATHRAGGRDRGARVVVARRGLAHRGDDPGGVARPELLRRAQHP